MKRAARFKTGSIVFDKRRRTLFFSSRRRHTRFDWDWSSTCALPIYRPEDPLLRPWAVVQLRHEDVAGTAYNLVGFQTRLSWPEQKRIFGTIPGLKDAEWLRMGQI